MRNGTRGRLRGISRTGRRADVAEWGRCEGEGGGREQVRRRVSVHAPPVISASARVNINLLLYSYLTSGYQNVSSI